MENNPNNSITISLKTVIVIIVVILVIVGGAGYLVYNNLKTDEDNDSKKKNNSSIDDRNTNVNTDNSNVNNSNVDTSNTIVNNNNNNTSSNGAGIASSKTNPLSFNQWGLASRYTTGGYKNVSVSITNVTRGAGASTLVKEYCDNPYVIYKYEDAKEGMEWAVFDYSVDLSSIMTSNGASIKVDSMITGTGDNNSIKYNGKIYIVSTMDMSNSDYIKETVGHGKFAVQLPIGCTDYLVAMGREDSTAYFMGK